MVDLNAEFLIVGHAKDTDASVVADSKGLSVKHPISKRIVIATLSDHYRAFTASAVDDVLQEIGDTELTQEVRSQPPLSDELVSVFNPADDRAILMTGLDKNEYEAIMNWRRSRNNLNAGL